MTKTSPVRRTSRFNNAPSTRSKSRTPIHDPEGGRPEQITAHRRAHTQPNAPGRHLFPGPGSANANPSPPQKILGLNPNPTTTHRSALNRSLSHLLGSVGQASSLSLGRQDTGPIPAAIGSKPRRDDSAPKATESEPLASFPTFRLDALVRMRLTRFRDKDDLVQSMPDTDRSAMRRDASRRPTLPRGMNDLPCPGQSTHCGSAALFEPL